jgi:hypothetical protein
VQPNGNQEKTHYKQDFQLEHGRKTCADPLIAAYAVSQKDREKTGMKLDRKETRGYILI